MNRKLRLAEGWWRAGWFPAHFFLCLNHFKTPSRQWGTAGSSWFWNDHVLSVLFCYLLTPFSHFFFSFQTILSPCLFCSFTFFYPCLFSCPSALFLQLIWLVCLSYLHVIISTAVAATGLNWAPIVQFKCTVRDSKGHPQEFMNEQENGSKLSFPGPAAGQLVS